VLWGFLIWAASHVLPNGSLVPVLLFGGMAAFSILGFFLLDLKARRRMGTERWFARSAGTSSVPFTALLQGRASWRSLRPLMLPALVAVFVYAWFILQGHALLIGPDPPRRPSRDAVGIAGPAGTSLLGQEQGGRDGY
jgi:uncharacterized membrane protein